MLSDKTFSYPSIGSKEAVELLLELFAKYAPRIAAQRIAAKEEFIEDPDQAHQLAQEALRILEPRIRDAVERAEELIECNAETLDRQIAHHDEAENKEITASKIFAEHAQSTECMYQLVNAIERERGARSVCLTDLERMKSAGLLLEQPHLQTPSPRKITIHDPHNPHDVLMAIMNCEPHR